MSPKNKIGRGYFTSIEIHPFGILQIARSERGITRIEFGRSKRSFMGSLSRELDWIDNASAFDDLRSELTQFISGARRRFNIELDIQCGTEFQREVWDGIAKVPYGKTISYSELAKSIGRPKSIRAVANACGANPVPIIVPCHRVVASGGGIGGFSSGIKNKRLLLDIESQMGS